MSCSWSHTAWPFHTCLRHSASKNTRLSTWFRRRTACEAGKAPQVQRRPSQDPSTPPPRLWFLGKPWKPRGGRLERADRPHPLWIPRVTRQSPLGGQKDRARVGVLGSPSSRPLPEDSRTQLLAPCVPKARPRGGLGSRRLRGSLPVRHTLVSGKQVPGRKRGCQQEAAFGRRGGHHPTRQRPTLALARRRWEKEAQAPADLGAPSKHKGQRWGALSCRPGRAPRCEMG